MQLLLPFWAELRGLVAGRCRARRDSRDAARRSRPSSSSSSAGHDGRDSSPCWVAVSTPSR